MVMGLRYAALGGQPSSKGDRMPVSPASSDRPARTDQALDQARRDAGVDRNVRDADQQLEPSHGDPPRSAHVPGTTQNGRAAR